MSKGIFFNLPGAKGHVNPTLAVIERLVERGETIIYYADRGSKDDIESTGAIFRDFGEIHPFLYQKSIAMDLMALAIKQQDILEAIFPTLLTIAEYEKPDYIIYDSCCVWGKRLAQAIKKPGIGFITTVVANPRILLSDIKFFLEIIRYFLRVKEIVKMTRRTKQFMKTFDLPYHGLIDTIFDILRNKGDLTLVSIMPEFQPFVRSLSDDYVFFGYKPYEKKKKGVLPFPIPDNEKVIYVAMGTLHHDHASFYKSCIQALKIMKTTSIVSISPIINRKIFGSIPDYIHLMDFAPQLDILPSTRLFLSHGGANSIHESLYYGVPLLLFPQTPEQYLNAKNVEKLGAGKIIHDRNPSAKTILRYAREILDNPAFNENAVAFSRKMHIENRIDQAVEKILDMVLEIPKS